MASIQTASVNTLAYLQRKNKITYVSLVVLLSIFLLLDYIPGYSTWVTPPVALFLGLIFALSSGQAHPKFNKKVSKYLLQYSVVGFGFRINLPGLLYPRLKMPEDSYRIPIPPLNTAKDIWILSY